MKNLRVKILVVLAVLVLGATALFYFTGEPSVDGRSLSKWLRISWESPLSSHKADATNAVRTIGAKAVPILLDKLRAQDPAWKRRFDNAWGWRVFSYEWFHTASYSTLDANSGFSILGTQAMAALPELSKMLFDTNNDTAAGVALGYLGPAAWPVLREALTNDHLHIAFRAVYGIGTTPEVARLAIPEIHTLLHTADARLAGIFLLRCEAILPKDEALVLTISFLNDPRPQVQGTALNLLARSTNNSARVVPFLLPLLTSTNGIVARQAASTLCALDPATATAHGVNTNLYLKNRSPK